METNQVCVLCTPLPTHYKTQGKTRICLIDYCFLPLTSILQIVSFFLFPKNIRKCLRASDWPEYKFPALPLVDMMTHESGPWDTHYVEASNFCQPRTLAKMVVNTSYSSPPPVTWWPRICQIVPQLPQARKKTEPCLSFF